MPVYEFECPECEATFEELIPFSEIEQVVCRVCGCERPRRLLSAFATTEGGAAPSGGACGGGSGFG